MKILMCGNHPKNLGGMTSVINQIMSKDWSKENVEINFVPTFYPGNVFEKSIYFCYAYVKIFFKLLFEAPDIVYMHMSYKGSFHRKFFVHKMCKAFGIKDIVHLHGGTFEEWYNGVDEKTKQKVKTLLRESNVVVVLGEKWKNVAENIEPQVNVVVLHNAVAIPSDIVRWNEECCQVLYMGVLVPVKGLDKLLETVLLLKESGKAGSIHFAIAGSGPKKAELKNYCKMNGLETLVSFHGWVKGEEKEKLIRTSQIAVISSYHEGLPISILEAISYGMPVVATNVGDMASAVTDGLNGYLVEPGDVESLAECLSKIARDKKMWMEFSKESRRIAQEKFSEKVFFEKLGELFRDI